MQSRFQEGPRSGVLAKPKHTLLVCETCNNCTMQTTNAGQGNKTLPLELRHQGVITCIVEHPVGFEGQPPTDAAPSFAPPHAAGCRSPAAGTLEESPVQAHIRTNRHPQTDRQTESDCVYACSAPDKSERRRLFLQAHGSQWA